MCPNTGKKLAVGGTWLADFPAKNVLGFSTTYLTLQLLSAFTLAPSSNMDWHSCFDVCCSYSPFANMERCPNVCAVRLSVAHFMLAVRLGKTNSNLQKHTVANCQGWGLPCCTPLHPPSEKLYSCLWCNGTSVMLLGAMPLAFLCIHPPSVWLTSVKTRHKWTLSSLQCNGFLTREECSAALCTTAQQAACWHGCLEMWRKSRCFSYSVRVAMTTLYPTCFLFLCLPEVVLNMLNFSFF